MEKGLRVVLTGGGTGGHIYPAIAIADYIRDHVPGSEFLFVGATGRMETRLVPQAGYDIRTVPIQGFARSLSPENIRGFFLTVTAPGKARKILKEFQPDIVIGTGGYACWPAMKAAQMMHIPTAVHESNVVPGLAIRRLQERLDIIFTNFEETADRLKCPEKCIHVGNPLRSGFGILSRTEAREHLGIPQDCHMVLSYGGSLGAPRITDAVAEMCLRQAAEHPDIRFYHAYGNRDVDAEENGILKQQLAELSRLENVHFMPYIHEMPYYMAAADVVISRAGAMTVSEMARMRKPAILIPSPNVVENHQYKNAKALADRGAAVLLEETDLNEERLDLEVLRLLYNPQKQEAMSQAIGTFNMEDPAARILSEIQTLIERKKQ